MVDALKHSDEINLISQAILISQNEIQDAYKNAESHIHKYADLNAFIDATREHLHKAGIVLTQHPVTQYQYIDEKNPPIVFAGCITMLIHAESGQYLKSTLLLPCTGIDPQRAGSAISYCRRYQIQSMLCLKAVDDDAGDASGNKIDPFQVVLPDNHTNDSDGHIIQEDQLQGLESITPDSNVQEVTPADIPEEVLPTTSFADCSKMIGSATTEKQLNGIYKIHIEGSTVLEKKQIATLIAQATQRKTAIQQKG